MFAISSAGGFSSSFFCTGEGAPGVSPTPPLSPSLFSACGLCFFISGRVATMTSDGGIGNNKCKNALIKMAIYFFSSSNLYVPCFDPPLFFCFGWKAYAELCVALGWG